MTKNDFAGVLLAGGQSSRFGSNKALAEFQGRRLIEFPAEILAEMFTSRLLVTNTPKDFEFLGWNMAGDIFPGQGPLAGIHTAMQTLPAPFLFVAGCDMPFLNKALISFLCEKAKQADAVIPMSANGPEPLHGVYSRNGLQIIEKCLRKGEKKIRAVLDRMNVLRIEEEVVAEIVGPENPFINVNTHADFKSL